MVEGVVGAVDGGMAQIENIGEMWDRLYESAIGGLVIIFCVRLPSTQGCAVG